MVDRNNFDSMWLAAGAKTSTYTKFAHSPLRERPGTRNTVKAALKQAVVDHHKHAAVVSNLLKKHGFKKASQILTSQLPKNRNTRMGNFGEVISSEHLRQKYGYAMPVFKLRYADNFLMPSRGEDILAFEMNRSNRVLCICLGETKTLGSFRTSAVVEAHDRLAGAFNPFPVSLSLIANILYERRNNALADQIEEIIARLAYQPFPRKNWIFVICGSEPATPFDAIQTKSQVVPNLSCVDIYLPELQDLVKEMFDSPLTRHT